MDSIEWIPIENRLPIVGENVLVTIRDETGDTAYSYTTTGWYSGHGYQFVVDDEYSNYVTHWASFPRAYGHAEQPDYTTTAKIDYYNETVCGYPLKDLLLFATACRDNNVSCDDLKDFANNVEFAFKAVQKEQEKIIGKYICSTLNRKDSKDGDTIDH